MDHTGLPLQTTPYLPLPCERSPDGSTWTTDIWFSSLLIYRPRKNERLSWPSWLTYSGRYTHISGHTSTADRAEARESSPVRDRRSNHWATQPTTCQYWHGSAGYVAVHNPMHYQIGLNQCVVGTTITVSTWINNICIRSFYTCWRACGSDRFVSIRCVCA